MTELKRRLLKLRIAARGDIKKPNIVNERDITTKQMTPKEFLDLSSSSGLEAGLAGIGSIEHNSGKVTGLSDLHSSDPTFKYSISRDTSQNDWFEDEGQNTENKILGTGSDERPSYRKYKKEDFEGEYPKREIFRGDELGSVEYLRRKLRHGRPIESPTLWVNEKDIVTDHE